MAVNSISSCPSSTNITPSVISPSDTEAKNIQNQITSKTQSLNRLSSDSQLSAEEKIKERQELQKQIAELNRKLRILQMEKKEEAKEAQEKQEETSTFSETQLQESSKSTSAKDMLTDVSEKESPKTNIPLQNIQKLLEAGTQLQKERIQLNVSNKKKLSENILESEIKSDELLDTDTKAKKEKLRASFKKEPIEIISKEQPAPSLSTGKKISGKIVFSDNSI